MATSDVDPGELPSHAVWAASRGQAGYVLTTVLAVMLLLTFVVTALLAYTFVGLRLSKSSIDDSNRTRAIDGALETGLQVVRENGSACSNPDLGLPASQYSVECLGQLPPKDNTAYIERIVDLGVLTSSGSVVGKGRVRIVDLILVPDDPLTTDVDELQINYGYTVEVCDWQLGIKKQIPLKGCS